VCGQLVSEVCVKEHETRGMGVVIGSWGMGLTFGPALGGLLAER
jgi:predicted MFS family arabinose efflux permease